MEYCISGPIAELPDKGFSELVFERLSSNRSEEKMLVNVGRTDAITLQELQRKCIQTAISLKKIVSQDDVIACLCEKEWLSNIPIISSLYLGVTISLVNPAYNARELLLNFSTSRPKVIFCKKTALENVLKAKENADFIETIILTETECENGFITIHDLINAKGDVDGFKPILTDQSKTAIILSSSGTSGLPKSVKLTYQNLLYTMPHIEDINYIGMKQGITFLVLVPLFHIFGLYLSLYSAICGSKAIFLQEFRPEAFLKAIQDYGVNKLTIVPPLAIFLAKSPLVDHYNLSHLKDVLCGAAPLSQEVLNLLEKRLQVKVRQLYGLTETGLVAAVTANKPLKPNTTGSIVFNVKAIIKDPETKNILPRNNKGEICLKGPTIFNGYLSNIEETNVAFDENGYFYTGDIGYFDDDDNLYIVDRLKELIKCKGFQVAPAELEGILLTHNAVKEVAVIGVPHERDGEVPCAVIVKQAGADVGKDDLIAFVKGKVAKYKELTGGVRFVDEIPKNANGKIMKRDIRKIINGS